MFKACAIMALHNEADIVQESVKKLIDQGVDVYLIDNNSTDGSVEKVSESVGKGIVDIETVKFFEDGNEVYDWTSILKRKEEIAKKLDYDWYLHVDADEIRYSPWAGVSLREGLERVNFEGYSLVDFKLFNFRITHNISFAFDYENSMNLYSAIEDFNTIQVKAWKKCGSIQLTPHGGHLAEVQNANIYPLRFILKHYPIRSAAHGQKKVFMERMKRFTRKEREKGWHVQYNHLIDNNEEQFFWQPEHLCKFSLPGELSAIYQEGHSIMMSATSPSVVDEIDEALTKIRMRYARYWLENKISQSDIITLVENAHEAFDLIMANENATININHPNKTYIQNYINSLADMLYLKGNALVKSRLSKTKFT